MHIPNNFRLKHSRRLFLPLALVVVASLACSLPGLRGLSPTPQPPTASPSASPRPPEPTATPAPQPPDLVEVDPPPGVELALNRSLTLYFNQPMERASVEQALAVAPGFDARLEWVDDSTLLLQPENPLQPDSEVVLDLGTQARSARGLAMLRPVRLSYHTSGYLQITQMLPEPGAAEVDPQSAVVAAFNRPVVPLGEAENQAPAFTLEPATAGRGEWLNSSTYIFYPEPALYGGTVYSVQFDPNLSSLDGSPLDGSVALPAWNFSTSLPSLVKVEPEPAAGPLALDAEIVLHFNQPLEPTSTEAAVALLGFDGQPVAGTFEWRENGRLLAFKPQDLLRSDETYRLVVGSEARSLGGAALGVSSEFSWNTFPPLRVVRSDPPPGGVREQYGGISLYMSRPLVENFDPTAYFSLEPAVTNFSAWWNPYDRIIYVSGDFAPETDYRLVLSGDLPDAWGGTLVEPYVLNFRSPSLDPALFVNLVNDVLYLTPSDSAVVAQVTNMDRLPISVGSLPLQDFVRLVSGPDTYNERQRYRAPNQRNWVQAVDTEPNLSQEVDVYISPDQNPLAPGLYYLRFNLNNERIYAGPYLFVVSNAQLTFKLSPTQALVWAVDIRTNQALAGEKVQILDSQGALLAEGVTDAQGIFQSSIPTLSDTYSSAYAVVGEQGSENFGVALSTWSFGLSPWNFNLLGDPRPPHLMGYVYTDRPIYRPGDTVYFRAIVRQAYNGRYDLPDLGSLPLTLYQEYGQAIVDFDLPLTPFGTADSSYTLPADARPGYYRIASSLADYEISVNFQVAEYRKPEIDLQVQFSTAPESPGEALAGQPVSAQVNARYFFGAPAGGLQVKWAIYKQQVTFDYPGYQVGRSDFFSGPFFPFSGGFLGDLVEESEAVTDPQGQLSVEFTPTPDEERYGYTLEVTVQDESGLPVSGRAALMVNPALYYVAVRPDSWVGRAGEALEIETRVVDWFGKSAGERDLRAEFSKVNWRQVETSPKDPYQSRVEPEYTLVGSTDFRTSSSGAARLAFTPDEPGNYLVEVIAEGTRTNLMVWVGGVGRPVWPELPDRRVTLTADRESYQPGETATVFIPNPLNGEAYALMAVERGQVLEHQVFTLPAGGGSLSIPLGDDEAPNVYLSITLLGQDENGRPDFRQGYVNLPVAPLERTLQVSLDVQPQQAGPGDAVTLDLQIQDASGAPVQGEFSMAVVDRAVLALAEPNVPDILSAFYGNQGLGVRTGVSLSVYAGRAHNEMGGGGGGGDGLGTTLVTRQNFPDTAFWQGVVLTDAQGRAQLTVNLPDSLTTWQVLARGVGPDTRVGQAELNLVVSRDLLIRPVVPRFLVAGDHVRLAAVVQNNTGDSLTVEASLQAAGADLDDPGQAVQTVTVPTGGRQEVAWWAVVLNTQAVDLLFQARSGELSDAVRPAGGALPVLRYESPQAFRSAGVLSEAGEIQEVVSLPRSFSPDNASLDVELSSSLAGVTLRALGSLQHTRYEITEHTLSRFLPNLEMYQTVQQYSLDLPDLQANLETNISLGLKRLQAVQNEDGGWGWWYLQESEPFLSAYVLFGLSRARQAGVQVQPNIIEKAAGYLLATLTPASMQSDDSRLDRLAMVHFALAEAGYGDAPGAAALYELRARLNPWAQAFLAVALEDLEPGSERARTVRTDLQASAVRSASGVHWEKSNQNVDNFDAPLANSAVVLYALARQEPGSPLLADATRYLVSQRKRDGGWGSSYTTAWAILAASQVMRGTGELAGDFSFDAHLNESLLVGGNASASGSPVTGQAGAERLYADDPNALRIQRTAGQGRLYYAVTLNASRPAEDAPALSQGIQVARTYHPGEAKCLYIDCPEIQEARAGEQVQVHLSLTLPQAVYYLMVEDFLPAGSEVLDLGLKTSQQGEPSLEPADLPLYDPSHPYEKGWGWWLFSPPRIYDERVTWAARYLPAGNYELTYTLVLLQPGEFRVLPAHAWAYYFPDVQGTSAGTVFAIRP